MDILETNIYSSERVCILLLRTVLRNTLLTIVFFGNIIPEIGSFGKEPAYKINKRL
jgi:hypothetical protein